jgi:cytoplasmic iron level regulating protein YaaA (DUF328/UPF0246 family)
MLSIISPAKKLLEQPKIVINPASELLFQGKSTTLVNLLQSMTVADIANLMSLSENLAKLNFERYQDFNFKGSTQQPSGQAIFLFQGDVYQSLDAASLTTKDLNYAQAHLAILSGLYGLVRPLDLIQPYRLEMGTKLANPAGNDLYAFWQNTVTDYINQLLENHKNPLLINLASNEYSKVVNKKNLKYPMVTVHFKETKNGQLKSIGIFAKKARGAMARYMIEHQVDSLDGLLDFTELDYRYQASLSSEKEIVFAR